MPGRISPGGKRKNAFGPQLRKLRIDRGLSATAVIAKLQLLGWDVAASSYSQLECGKRIIGDVELLLILNVLEGELSELEIPRSLRARSA